MTALCGGRSGWTLGGRVGGVQSSEKGKGDGAAAVWSGTMTSGNARATAFISCSCVCVYTHAALSPYVSRHGGRRPLASTRLERAAATKIKIFLLLLRPARRLPGKGRRRRQLLLLRRRPECPTRRRSLSPTRPNGVTATFCVLAGTRFH